MAPNAIPHTLMRVARAKRVRRLRALLSTTAGGAGSGWYRFAIAASTSRRVFSMSFISGSPRFLVHLPTKGLDPAMQQRLDRSTGTMKRLRDLLLGEVLIEAQHERCSLARGKALEGAFEEHMVDRMCGRFFGRRWMLPALEIAPLHSFPPP
jgi:hypothetical protein